MLPDRPGSCRLRHTLKRTNETNNALTSTLWSWRNAKRVLLFLLWTIPVGFIENAFFGWAQMELGVTNELVSHVLRFSIMWGVPALTVAVGYYFSFLIERHFDGGKATPTPPPPAKSAPLPEKNALRLTKETRQALGIDPSPQHLARAMRDSASPKRRFQAPPGKENTAIASRSNRDLGDMMVELARDLQRHIARAAYNTTNEQFVNAFLANHAQEVFWLCEEARNRGLHNDHLDLVMKYPDRLQNRDAVTFIARELEKFGNIVKLYN